MNQLLIKYSPVIAITLFIIFIIIHLSLNKQYEFPDGISLLSLGRNFEISAFIFFLLIGIFLLIASNTYIPKIYDYLIKLNSEKSKKIRYVKRINMILVNLGIIGMILQSVFNLNIPFSKNAIFQFLDFGKLKPIHMIIIHHILAFGSIAIIGVSNILLAIMCYKNKNNLDSHSIIYKIVLSILFSIFLGMTFIFPIFAPRNIISKIKDLVFVTPFFHQITFIILCILFYVGFVYDYDNLYLKLIS